MHTLGLVFTAVSTLAWTSLDAARKRLLGPMQPWAIAAWLGIGQVPLFALWRCLEPGPLSLPDLPTYGPLWVATVALNTWAHLLFLSALRMAPLSRMLPILATGPVWAMAIGIVLLGEWPTWPQIPGVLLVAVGIACIARAAPTNTACSSTAEATPKALWAGAWRMMLVALGWSLSAALEKWGLTRLQPPIDPATHGMLQSLGLGVVGFVALGLGRQRSQIFPPKAALPALGFAIFASGVAVAFQLLAISHVTMTLFETCKRAGGMVLAVVLGRIFFAEPVHRQKIVAIVALIAGVALMLMGRAA